MSGMITPVILVVEDERPQLEMLSYNLSKEGFKVSAAEDGEEALIVADEIRPDLIVLDWMLPNVSGIEICRRLKARDTTAHIPIIMLTARGDESDRVRGLNTGADDYVVKPYAVSELIARIRAALRRARPASVGQTLSFRDITLDSERHRVVRNGKPIHLGPTEYRLLCTLIEKPGRVWSRDQLLDLVWGRDKDVDIRTVDVHIGRLRKALKTKGKKDPIRTVRGAGYSLDSDT
ncbi:MAG: phosphate regulon transcriptional regulator PhoB [Rhizobiaceae bacterium]